ncbi:MAG: methyltransferase domain-containing protein [Methylophilaceae bacterium]|jgi:hypothetical protein|nr:methyltransferase domain-containing protein [Methylophilaceae bacterium]
MGVRTTCNICSNNELVELIKMPKMPLTGLYLEKKDLENNLYDQGFNYCKNCGHGQLKNVIDADLIYDDSYSHRTSGSNISISGNDFFFNTIESVVKNKEFNQILEIGCNDAYLIKKLSSKAKNLIGIDPVWKDKDFIIDNKISIKGKFINELDDTDLNVKPDLIISSHTFEHVDGIYEEFFKLVDLAADDCLFFIEVPSLESTINQRRYDQIFHQHLQYFSYSSMRFLIERIGCEFMGSKYNYSLWGGTSLYWFKKTSKINKEKVPNNSFNIFQEKQITDNYNIYKKQLQESLNQMQAFDEEVIGFGAAQMLPIIGYHMESNLDWISKIYDDNDNRVGKYLPYISPKIEKFSSGDITDSIVLITALDSTKPLLKKILNYQPRRIYTLTNIF